MLTQVVSALSLTFFCYLLTQLSFEVDRPTVNDLKLATTVYGVVKANYDGYSDITETVEEQAVVEQAMDKHLDKYSDDYLGAIEIPSIETSDPIYKGEGEYYLNYNYEKKANKVGEVYLDDRTGDSLSKSGILLNGHAVPNGKKFGNFKKLLDIEEQPEVFIYDHSLEKVITYKMLFVSLIDGGNSGIVMNFDDEQQQVKYYKNLYATAIKQWEEPTEEDSFLLLNSCAYIIQDGRYVVVAKKEG